MTHQCTVCLKHFDFVSKLRRHQLTHSGQRPFTCSVCLKAFRQAAHLKGHLKSHSKLREVSLIVSRAVRSQISYTKSADRYSQHAGTEISEEGDGEEENMWYSSHQKHDESELHDQNDDMNQQKLVTHLIAENGQMCDFTQESYDGFEDLSLEESFQNCPYYNCTKMLTDSEKSSVEKVSAAVHTSAVTHQPGTMVKMPNKHQCSVCLKCFSAPSKLKRHILIHSSLRPFCCHLCPKAFRQLAHLKMHLSTHLSQRQSKAKGGVTGNSVSPNPNLSLGCMSTLVYHSNPSEKRGTEEAGDLETELEASENIDLEPCPKNVKRVKSLNCAESWTEGKVGHECSVCHKCFSAPSKLRRHCLIHTEQRPFQCSLCCSAFRQLSHLKAHNNVHTGPRKNLPSPLQMLRSTQPQPCSSRASKAKMKRLLHISLIRKFKSAKQKLKMSAAKITTDENISETGAVKSSPEQEIIRRQNYSCCVCSKHFNAPSKLRRHVLTHTGQRPFRCSVCRRGFRQKSHLKVHKCNGGSVGKFQSGVRDVHLRDPADGSSNENFREGEEISRGNFLSSSGIGESYVCSPSIRLASKSICEDNPAPLACEIPRPLDEANQNKESGYQCTVCFKIFDFPSKLSRHFLIHLDVKPFKCNICSKSFRQLCHLQSHSKVHTLGKIILCQGTYTRGMETSIPEMESFSETSYCRGESEKPPVVPRPDPYCDKHIMNLVNNSCSNSINVEEFKQNSESTSSVVEVCEGEDFSIQMKRNSNQCVFCLKTFDFPSKLSRHLLVHTGIRPYECQVCCKSFKQLSHLQCHQWVHKRKHDHELPVGVESPVSTDGTALTDEPNVYQESSEDFTMNQGHDGFTLQVHQKWISEDSSCGHDESMIKSENDDLVDKSVHPSLKHDYHPSGSDATSSTILYTQLDPHVEQLEHRDVTQCLNRPVETPPSAAERTSRIPVCSSVDQQEMGDGRDPGPFEQKIVRTNFTVSIYEDCSRRSPTVPASSELYHHHQDYKNEDDNQHLTEPPNDLPICPSCSQCFDSLQKLKAHSCPVRSPKQRLTKSYQCAVCFKSFEAPSKLKRHYVIHTGQRPYRCNTCDKGFTQSSHLKTHMLTHR